MTMRETLHPEGFHGAGRTSKYFEGWYVKLVGPDRVARLAVIPGVFLAPDRNGAHEAFVQVLDGATGRSWYQLYPLADFEAQADAFGIRVGPNTFDVGGVHLDLPDVGLSGNVRFTTPFDPWPVTVRSPGSMGWYAWMPFMECYHGVLSFGHSLDGALRLEGQALDFAGGRGYIEKDWGQAFPSGYVWMHSNHFGTPGLSLMASAAIIPWLRGSFRGLLIGLRTPERLYRFATYTGAKCEHLAVDDEHAHLVVRSRDGHRLQLRAERRGGALLHAPVRTQMHQRVEETLDAVIHLELTDRHGRTLLQDTGTVGGLEVYGDISRLQSMSDRRG